MDLAERSRRAVWHPCTQMQRHEAEPLLAIARAEGPWLIDEQGGRHLDAISSWWTNLFGHGHPRMVEALSAQLRTLDHVMLAGLTHGPVVELSERLGAATGLGHAFYASDGSSATEIALKMSAHAWANAGQPGKQRFAGLAGGYHGETVGALAVTDIPLFRAAYAPLIRLAATLPSPDARGAQAGEDACAVALRVAAEIDAWLAANAHTTAALILEPLIQCAGGFAMHDAEFLRRVRASCTRHQVHLVLDEIAVGFGRTGTLFAHQQAATPDQALRPDFLCLSKGLTGGVLPLSAVLTTDAVYAAFYDREPARGFLHSHSYTGNPLACRAALTVLDLFEQDDVLARNAATAAALDAALAPLHTHPALRHARRLGMVWAWDLAPAWAAALAHEPGGFAGAFHRAARARGLLLRPIGPTLYLMPPYGLGAAEIAHLAEGTLAALEATLAGARAPDPRAAPHAPLP